MIFLGFFASLLPGWEPPEFVPRQQQGLAAGVGALNFGGLGGVVGHAHAE
jgi:hypothetical protein